MSEQVLQVLTELGTTRDEVAATLTEGGFQGSPFLTECPVARYLKARTGETFYVHPRQVLHAMGEYTANPVPVEEFIRDFDEGYFPHLQTGYEQ